MDVWSLTIKDVAHRIVSKEDTHLKITQLGAENAWECAGQEHLDDHNIKPVSTMQKTGWTNYSPFLVLCGLEKGFTLDVIIMGQSKTIFSLYWAIFDMVTTKPTNRPNG